MTIIDSIYLCFLEGTKILCFDQNTQTEIYIPIQNLKVNDLIKTNKSGYMPLNMIGFSKIYNSGDDERIKNRLYKCTPTNYPEVFEDLIITGCHSILVDKFKENERQETIDILTRIFITEDKYRLPACVDKKSIPYQIEGTFTIYHIALDNENYYGNYGVWANGLLVETCSKRQLTELSGMKFL